MMQYSFVAYWNITVREVRMSEEGVEKAAKAMVQNMKECRIRISDREGKTLFDNTASAPDGGLLEGVDSDSRGYLLRKTESGYELQTAGMILSEGGEVLYLETIRDVTVIFEEREEQYNIYRRWMAGLFLLESLCCYGMAAWLLRPLQHLSETTRKLAGGNLSVRAKIKSEDEFGELSRDFNRMADSLERQVHELEDGARRQEDFIGSFAHELKTPLTSMIGYADMLRSQELKPEEQLEAANYIFKEGKRLEALSLKLLDLLVIRHDTLELKQVPCKWLIQDIEGILRPSLQKTGIKLTVLAEDAQIWMEPDLMKTVLLNLLDNGRKAMAGAGNLYLLGRKEESGYAFYVRDSGKGMPECEITRITEAFYMIDKSRAREQGGAGLGLSICAEIIKRHRGVLEFQSAEGKGTLVRIYLPEVTE